MMDRGDRRFWVITGVLAAMLLALTMTTTEVTRNENSDFEYFSNRSVFNGKPTGYRAWHVLLEKTGLPVMVWRKDFQSLEELPGPATMIMLEPYTVAGTRDVVFGNRDLELLMNWVSKGNTLVFADDFTRKRMRDYAQIMGITVVERVKGPQRQGSALEGQQSERLMMNPAPAMESLSLFVDKPLKADLSSYIQTVSAKGTWLLADEAGRPVGMDAPFRQGRIILLTVPGLADNSRLQNTEIDNFQWLTNLVVSREQPVYVNEFVHGYSDIPDLFTYYYQRTPFGRMAVQLLVALLFVFWLSFAPWRPRQNAPEERQVVDLTRFTASLAGIFYRRRAAAQAISPYLTRIDQLLRRKYRFGLEDRRRLGNLLESLFGEYSGRNYRGEALAPARLMESIDEARQLVAVNRPLPPEDVYRLGRQLSTIQERLTHGNAREHRSREHAPETSGRGESRSKTGHQTA